MKARHIPNIVTFSRFLFTIAFVIIGIIDTPFHPAAMICFFLGAVSDMIDGPLARRIKGGATNFGADIDTLADLFMIAAGIGVIATAMDIWPVLVPALIIALSLKFTTGITAYVKHGKVFFVHTVLAKTVVMLLFLGTIIYFILNAAGYNAASYVNWHLSVCIAIVAIHCFEEHLIISKIDYPAKNTKTIFHVKGMNEKYRARLNKGK
ncbi:MAG: CDP-alcohol phosphatidyltransferase family protein [Oscillospiraceae bacterium]|nr:CDP-alcohol phosphatidyltransferase family protein [Oscillospiraceae bacterium]